MKHFVNQYVSYQKLAEPGVTNVARTLKLPGSDAVCHKMKGKELGTLDSV